MPKKVLGLDIGTSSIKICELGSTFKGFKVIRWFEKGLPRSGSVESRREIVINALKELKEENSLGGETVISSIPGHLATVKLLSLPFQDSGKISQTIKFELETSIPYPIEEVLVDFHIASRDSSGSQVLTWAIPKRSVSEHLSLLEAVNWGSASLELDYIAMANLFLELKPPVRKKGCFALIDMGASKTSILIFDNTNLKYVRSFIKGGDFLTELISKNLNLSLNEAEEAKIKGEMAIETSLAQGFELIQKEIERSFLAFFSLFSRDASIEEIYFTGGGAKVKGLLEFLSNAFTIKTHYFDPSSSIRFRNQAKLRGPADFINVSAGLAMRGLNSPSIELDLRQEEFAPPGKGKEFKRRAIFIGVAIIIIAALFSFDVYQKIKTKEDKYRFLRHQIRHVFSQTLPEVKNVVHEIDQLKAKLKEEQAKATAFGGSVGSQLSALDLLREVSNRTPKAVKIDVNELIIDQEAVRMTGETNSFDAVDGLKKALELSPYFKEIKINHAKVGSNENIVEFRISIFLKAGEKGGL